MKNKIVSVSKALLSDLTFWLYLFGCLTYLSVKWDILQHYTSIGLVIITFIFTGFFFIFGDSFGRKLFFSSPRTAKKWYQSFWGWSVTFSLLVTFVVGWNIVQVDMHSFFTKFKNASGITTGIFDPNITSYHLNNESIKELKQLNMDESILKSLEQIKFRKYPNRKILLERLETQLGVTIFEQHKADFISVIKANNDMLFRALAALAETIFLALLATVFAIPFAFAISFFAARNLMPKTILGNSVYVMIRTIATFIRSVEAIVWAIIFSVWVGIGPFAGMLALMIHSIAALTKLYSEQIENIDEGQVEAIKATGASTLQIWVFAVIPQIISPYLAFTIYRWDINVRMATIVGFVGGGGIGLLLQQQQQMLQWRDVGLIIWLIAIVVWLMDMFSARIREKLIGN
jgi:phosphonate ABC transporter permease subunit PhnE